MTPTALPLPCTGALKPFAYHPQSFPLRVGLGLPSSEPSPTETKAEPSPPPSVWLKKDPHTGFTLGETAATGTGFVVFVTALLAFLGTRPAQALGPWRHFGTLLLAAGSGALVGVFTPNLIKGLQRWLSTDDPEEDAPSPTAAAAPNA